MTEKTLTDLTVLMHRRKRGKSARLSIRYYHSPSSSSAHTTDVITIDALNLFAKVFFAKLFNPHVETMKELV
jgi:hypothetical protein